MWYPLSQSELAFLIGIKLGSVEPFMCWPYDEVPTPDGCAWRPVILGLVRRGRSAYDELRCVLRRRIADSVSLRHWERPASPSRGGRRCALLVRAGAVASILFLAHPSPSQLSGILLSR